MATHSSILAREIPWIEEPSGLQSMGLQRVSYNLVTKQQQSIRPGTFSVFDRCSPCLFNLYAEYIMRNAGLEEAQAGIKIAGTNIKISATIMAESEEELKSLLMKVKEESEKVGLKLSMQKT